MSTDQTPAVLTGTLYPQADLFGDGLRLRSLSDDDFRLLCSEVLARVARNEAETAYVVGTMLAEANQRWDKKTYGKFLDDAAEITGREKGTLWRWRRRREDELGIAPEQPRQPPQDRVPRSSTPPISRKKAKAIDVEVGELLAGTLPDEQPKATAEGQVVADLRLDQPTMAAEAGNGRTSRPDPPPPPGKVLMLPDFPTAQHVERVASWLAAQGAAYLQRLPAPLFERLSAAVKAEANRRWETARPAAPHPERPLERHDVTPRFKR